MKFSAQSKAQLRAFAVSEKKELITQSFKALPLLFLLGSDGAWSATNMTLNFNAGPGNNSFYPGACNMSDAPVADNACGISPTEFEDEPDPDKTPFFQGTYTDPDTQISYWHIIVGDPATGFAMESYTPVINSYESTSGGKPSKIFQRGTESLETRSGNGWDPLGLDPSRNFDYTGNATGDPTKTIMRQVMGGSWNSTTNTWSCQDSDEYCSEFLKSNFLFKPIITQQINEPDFVHKFSLDMSTIKYDDDSTTGELTNTVVIIDDDMPEFDPKAGDFKMDNDSIEISMPDSDASILNPNITGGRYTYSQCNDPQLSKGIEHCWQDNDINNWDYQVGTYSYIEGDADVLNYDWDVYFIPSQNGGISGNESKCANSLAGSC